MNEKQIIEIIKSLDNEVSECCEVPLLYRVGIDKSGDVCIDKWDFCPSCLECC